MVISCTSLEAFDYINPIKYNKRFDGMLELIGVYVIRGGYGGFSLRLIRMGNNIINYKVARVRYCVFKVHRSRLIMHILIRKSIENP